MTFPFRLCCSIDFQPFEVELHLKDSQNWEEIPSLWPIGHVWSHIFYVCAQSLMIFAVWIMLELAELERVLDGLKTFVAGPCLFCIASSLRIFLNYRVESLLPSWTDFSELALSVYSVLCCAFCAGWVVYLRGVVTLLKRKAICAVRAERQTVNIPAASSTLPRGLPDDSDELKAPLISS